MWFEDKKLASKLLRQKPTKHSRLRYPHQVEQLLEQALYCMPNYDIEIKRRNLKGQKPKHYVRRLYLRMTCNKCQGKVWTSTCGTLHIRFKVEKLQNSQLRYPYRVSFNSQIYRMECQLCKQFGSTRIYDGQLQGVQMQFANIISQILKGNKPVPRKRKPVQIPKLIDHRSQLCQACRLKVCVYRG